MKSTWLIGIFCSFSLLAFAQDSDKALDAINDALPPDQRTPQDPEGQTRQPRSLEEEERRLRGDPNFTPLDQENPTPRTVPQAIVEGIKNILDIIEEFDL